MDKIRVRFAPSPTGPLHIGGVRTALYNYLFTKKNNGSFVLRIEDTDQKRYVEGAEEYIVDALAWLGLEFDESPAKGGDYGPYRQSERKDLYGQYANQLVESGQAYYAFDTSEDLEAMRERYMLEGIHSPKYDASTRMTMQNSLTMSSEEVREKLDAGAEFVIRLKLEPNQDVVFSDEIRGEVVINTTELDDKVLLKHDGLPTYHLANIVDDHLMEITHVIRGEEWLPSTAHHVLLYRALGWEETMPTFAHLPLILKPQGNGKLSKRDGAKFGFPVFPLSWEADDEKESFIGFKEFGFDPAATLNFLAFVGWNPGTDEEIFSLNELVDAFSIEHIVKSGARFNIDKAKWYNQQYIIHTDNKDLIAPIKELLAEKGIERSDEFLEQFAGLMKERTELFTDFYDNAYYFFEDVRQYEEKTIRKKWKDDNRTHAINLFDLIRNTVDFRKEELSKNIKGYIAEHELSFGNTLPMIRIATSGTTKGPDVFEMIEIMGKELVVGRLDEIVPIFDQMVAKA